MSDNHSNRCAQGNERYFFRASAEDFKKIPGSPIAYWIDETVRGLFLKSKLSELGAAKQGLATSDNKRFVRNWQEVSIRAVGFDIGNEVDSIKSGFTWFPYNKGGDKRRWYGNHEWLVNWKNGGADIR